jgi:hypothetical protein
MRANTYDTRPIYVLLFTIERYSHCFEYLVQTIFRTVKRFYQKVYVLAHLNEAQRESE